MFGFSILSNSGFLSSRSPSFIIRELSFLDLGDFDFFDDLSFDLFDFALEDFDLSLSFDDFFEDFFDVGFLGEIYDFNRQFF